MTSLFKWAEAYAVVSLISLRKKKRMLDGQLPQWSWLIPPVSPAATHIFHKEYTDELVSPNDVYQDKPYSS